MVAAEAARVSPWAFWAPASERHIHGAMEMLDLRPGERFVDLGCGDGRVLVEAARRGARVTGIEINPRMAAAARERLLAADCEGEVLEADMFAATLDADAVYAYLTPVTLARLKPALSTARAGARVVTPAYEVSGWRASAASETCSLYRMPAEPGPVPASRGWPWRAVVIVVEPGRRTLIPLAFDADEGPLILEPDGPLSRAAEFAVPDSWCKSTQRVPVDVIFRSFGAGSVIVGSLSCRGHALTLAVAFAKSGHGQWRFGPDEAPAFRQKLAETAASARRGLA